MPDPDDLTEEQRRYIENYRPWASEDFFKGVIGEMIGPLTEQYNHNSWRDMVETSQLIHEAASALRRADNVKYGFDEAGTDWLA